MNSQEPDNLMRQLFSEQRAEDGRRAPSFDRVWRNATARGALSAPVTAWGVRLALVSCAVLMAWVSVWLWNGTQKPQASAKKESITVVASLTDWTSPTECLLDSSLWTLTSSSNQ
jgi:type VI protein secretion system component VasF